MQRQKNSEIKIISVAKEKGKQQKNPFEETLKQLEQYDEGCEPRPRNFDSWGE